MHYSFYLGGSVVTLPAWLSAMAVNTWSAPGSNTLSSVDPALDPAVNPNYPGNPPWKGITGFESIVTGWSGAAWDEANKRLLITGGGHADYAGNEVCAWDAVTATFSRLNKPTGAIGNTGTLGDGLDATNPAYFDGRPRAAHTYNHLRMVDGVFWNFQGSTYVGGSGVRGAFKFIGNDWQRNGTQTFGNNYGGTIYDTLRSRFVTFSQGTGRPEWYNPTLDTKAQYTRWSNNDDSSGSELQLVHIPNRDLVVSFTANIQLFKLDGTADSTPATVSGISPNWSNNRLIGAVYDAANDRILCWNSGASIYVLTPPASSPLSNAWVWSKIDAVSGAPSAPASNGTYGRFWHSPSLNCVGVVNSVTEKMYVFRLG